MISPAPQMMPLADLLRDVPPLVFPGHSWEDLFAIFEKRELVMRPRLCERFMAMVKRRGIREPITIMEYFGERHVADGDYNLWTAWKLGLTEVPYVVYVETPKTISVP